MQNPFSHIGLAVVASCLLGLSACAVEAPAGPSLPVMPGDGKTLSQFQQDDATCRQFAEHQTGISPGAAANQAGLGSAAVGTVVGGAAGALIGAAAGNPAAGAAIGAGAGLLGGSAVGVGNAAASADNIQQHYDLAYQQCMASSGNKTSIAMAAPPPPEPQTADVAPAPTPAPAPASAPVPAPAPAQVYVYPPPDYYAYPPYAYYYPPYPYYRPRYYYARPYYYPRACCYGPRFSFFFGHGGYYHHY